MSLVVVSMGMTAFLAATMLTVDVGMLMIGRGQSQNAADAGALAGAIGLALNDYTDRSAGGPAVTGAIAAAKANAVMSQQASVEPSDVEFPNDGNGQANRVRVTVRRTAERGNPLSTFIAVYLGRPTVDVGATATAEASPANAMTCVKPFMIPDRWKENNQPANSTFDKYIRKDQLRTDADVYTGLKPFPNPNTDYSGYTTAKDVGTRLTLRAGTGDNINPSFYFSWKMPDDVGGDFYRENIANCNQSVIARGKKIVQEPGDKSGPTIQGIQALIDKDPAAYWDTGCQCVKGSAFAMSPRVFPIPLYDPDYYAEGKAHGREADFEIANFLGFFAEPPVGNSIPGRVTQIVGLVDKNAGPAPVNSFPQAIRLVE